MDEEQNLKIGMSILRDLETELKKLGYSAISPEAADNKISPDMMNVINSTAERVLKQCDTIYEKVKSDQFGLCYLYWIKGIAYSIYCPLKVLGTGRKSHKDKAIECFETALKLCPPQDTPEYNEMKGLIKFYLGQVYYVYEEDEKAIKCFEEIVNLLSVDNEVGMEAAKMIEKIKAEKKGGCFIATAAYGSPYAKEVVILRDFRDNVLAKSRLGNIFIRVYYLFSPFFAKMIDKSEMLKKLVRSTIIIPLIRLIDDDSKLRNEKNEMGK